MNGKTALGMILTSLLLGTSGLMFNVGLVSGQGLTKQWSYMFAPFTYLQAFCPSPGVADLGINQNGSEPDLDLEIVTGTDEFAGAGSPSNRWHCFDSTGAEEWVLPTGCDQSRTSVAIADIDGDSDFEIAGGTTSGWLMEVFSHTGGFVWTRWPWHYDFWTSPAICDVNPTVPGLEVIAATTGFFFPSQVFCFNGITGNTLWTSFATGFTQSSPACGDVDADGDVEVVIASFGGRVQCLNGVTGAPERVYTCAGAPCLSSAALANVDADANLEVIIGSGGSVYCFDGNTTALEWSFPTFGWVVSSPAVGDVDSDGSYEVVVGSMDSNVYCLDATTGALEWRCPTGGPLVSSVALANRGGFGLGIYIGSMDGSLYLLDGAGNLLNSFPTGAPWGITSSPAVADIDGNLSSKSCSPIVGLY